MNFGVHEEFAIRALRKPTFFIGAFLSAIFLAGYFPAPALNPPQGVSVTFGWDASPGSDITGYRLYYGLSSGNYSDVVDAGPRTQATINDLLTDTVYYFAITAYDESGNESDFSPEVTFPNIAGAVLTLAKNSANQAVLSGTAPEGTSYEIQATQDFVSWTAIGNISVTNGGFTFTDTDSTPISRGFYRLKQL